MAEDGSRLARLVSVSLLLVALGPGCAGPDEEAPQKLRVGMTCMDLTNPFFKLICNVMREEAAAHGYEVVCLDGNNDAAKQNNQLSDFVAQGAAAIFLNPADSRAAGEGVERAYPCSRSTSRSPTTRLGSWWSPTSAATTTRGGAWPARA